MADDQPNAVVSLGTPGNPSDPPAVRLVNAQGAVMKALFMQLVELVTVIGATWLLHCKDISPELWGAVCLYGGAGNLVNKIRGASTPSSTTAMVMSMGPAAVKGVAAASAARHVMLVFASTAIFLLFSALMPLFSGCGILANEDAMTVHAQAEDARDEINAFATELNRAGPLVTLYCSAVGEQSIECRNGRAGYQLSALSVEAARSVVQAYEDGKVPFEVVRRAAAQLERDLTDVRRVVALAQGVIDDVAAKHSQAPGSDHPTVDPKGTGSGPAPENIGRSGEPAPTTGEP